MPMLATQIAADKTPGLEKREKESHNAVKRSSSNLKKLFTKALRSTGVKSIFKSKTKPPKTPIDVVCRSTFLLASLDSFEDNVDPKRFDKMQELDSLLHEMKSILYGSNECEPAVEACAQLTQELFRDNTLRLIILCLPKLNLEARKDATRIVANLQRQPVNSRLIASDYLEANPDLMDHLVSGYDDPGLALHYGAMLRECIRHQVVARYVLRSEHMKRFFDYMQIPEFDVAADATATFKELMTRHKSTIAEFLFENYDWFFTEFNAKLLESANYITRRQAIKLLGDILLDRSNSPVMTRYVSSKDNLRILMNLLRESSKNIQLDAFHVFKLFVANRNKPSDIVNILVANRSKLLRFFASFRIDKEYCLFAEDEQFEADKAQVVKEIAELEAIGPLFSGELHKFPPTPTASGELYKTPTACIRQLI
ncbi:putative MO25-like protein At5g47540 isoform X1 [Nicotiana tomentosiformis]|uniref:putative MO25-like protein At5g47540 isoform X1 n=1 Tax=Nicotiana tomentosiformis TaxID=4098 RepID=UPI00051C7FF7|nr:putative MO25-like protein At5g47540 isoform X1 [Nicotiana tomentosiformis]